MSRPALSLLLASTLLLPAGCAFFDPLTGRSAAAIRIILTRYTL